MNLKGTNLKHTPMADWVGGIFFNLHPARWAGWLCRPLARPILFLGREESGGDRRWACMPYASSLANPRARGDRKWAEPELEQFRNQKKRTKRAELDQDSWNFEGALFNRFVNQTASKSCCLCSEAFTLFNLFSFWSGESIHKFLARQTNRENTDKPNFIWYTTMPRTYGPNCDQNLNLSNGHSVQEDGPS